MSTKVEKVSIEEFNTESAKPKLRGRQGQWGQVIKDIVKDKTPRKVTGLTKGSVAAGVRAAKEAGMRFAYSAPKNKTETTGYIIIAPAEETEKKKPDKKVS